MEPVSAAPLSSVSLSGDTAFARRHIGPSASDQASMLALLGYSSLGALADAAVPPSIRVARPLALPEPASEAEMLAELRAIASQNRVFRSFIGMGYSGTFTPPIVQRCILENPSWYTQYTPYQAEIAQGRLEMLLNFQTMVSDLTGLPVANASLLDEGTAAAEAMTLAHRSRARGSSAERFFVASDCHPQTIAVVVGRGRALDFDVVVDEPGSFEPTPDFFGMLLQMPNTHGAIVSPTALIARARAAGLVSIIAADIAALAVITPPGELGADIAVGSTQRFGVPMGFGGPHAAYFAAREPFLRQIPGRLIGVSRDAKGRRALRMAIQTREQHIRRDKATSNICTAQVLLAIIAAAYVVHHGPDGLRQQAEAIRAKAAGLRRALTQSGWTVAEGPIFDTLQLRCSAALQAEVRNRALGAGVNLRYYNDGAIGVSLDTTTTAADLATLASVFALSSPITPFVEVLPESLARTSTYLEHPTFHRYRSETELLRYLKRLEKRDLSLADAMIPLGSCTMKLNAAAEMLPITWPEFGALHPFVPPEQALGYAALTSSLERWLCEATGFDAVSLQPNSGSQGEYAGLLVIAAYHASRGEPGRTACLIPTSAHGTNPASAALAGFDVVAVACDELGNVDLDDLDLKLASNAGKVGALMVTYPSTHGVFETAIETICTKVHAAGGQVYLDGANMNAQVGLCRPGDYGADVCHLNLHKTFCIPHGGGGPGVGPIGVKSHLAPFLPGHPVVKTGGEQAIPAVSAAPWGSACILPIPWAYIRMMGQPGLTAATQVALLNANYVAKRLEGHYPILYKGAHGLVAHECIVDARPLKTTANVSAEDIAKRLIDYGFHAPTMSWPVAGTLMVEPTESESLAELDRFCDALIAIRAEAADIAEGRAHPDDNPLRNAPHTVADVTADEWPHPYSRRQAAWPAEGLENHKFWPIVSRVDNAFGDRNVVCTCPPMEEWSA